uniref:(California timema) hypothetical protein n=1 Tax=Timema californicum TaxID=61474 RepID=A0A7R9JCI0_TIMCA|nr:unnamed protein product [Timema californicum]
MLGCTKPDKPSPSNNIYGILTYQYRTMFSLPRVFLGFVLVTSALTLETVNYLDMANIDDVKSTYGKNVPVTLGPSIGVNKPTWGPYSIVNQPTWGPSNEVSQPILVQYTGGNQIVSTLRNDPSLAPSSAVDQPISLTYSRVNQPTRGPYTRVDQLTFGPYTGVSQPILAQYTERNQQVSTIGNYPSLAPSSVTSQPTFGPFTEVSQPILAQYTGINKLVTTIGNVPLWPPASEESQPKFGPSTEVDKPISGPFTGIINQLPSTPIVSPDKGTIPTSRLDCNDLVGCEINNSFENSDASDNRKNNETKDCGADFLNCYNKTSKQSNVTVSLNDCGNGTTYGKTPPSKLEPPLEANKNLTQIIRDIIVDFERESEFSNYTGVCGTENIPHTITRYIDSNETDADGATIIIETDTQTQYRTVPLCCHGYRKSLMGHCVPKCDGECLHGECVSPGNCLCHPRHALDRSGNCVPTCPRSCLNGRCSGNNTCVCNPGFAPSGAICIPVCQGGCVNGNCTAPGVCKCDPGYVSDNTNTCVPSCPGGCRHGRCTGPNVCSCKPGFRSFDQGNVTCVPEKKHSLSHAKARGRYYCDTACINGNCTRDNVCTCYPGFVKDPKYRSGNRCAPYCPGGCGVNGNCTAPNTCVCHPGYYRDFYKKQCLPFCPGGCVNGDCVAPDLCVCRPGYQMDFYKKQCVVARCTGQNCVNGVCTSQGTCVCNRGYVRDYVDPLNPRCVPHCQHGCVNAVCSAPNMCLCYPGYIKDKNNSSGNRCSGLVTQHTIIIIDPGCAVRPPREITGAGAGERRREITTHDSRSEPQDTSDPPG